MGSRLSNCYQEIADEKKDLRRTGESGWEAESHTALRFDGVPNEILKEVIMVYPDILLEAFNSCLRKGRFFDEWKRQRLVLLRKREKPLERQVHSLHHPGSGGHRN